MQAKILELVIANWDTLTACAVLGMGLLLTWLKRRAEYEGNNIMVTAVENFHKHPPPIRSAKMAAMKKTIQRLAQESKRDTPEYIRALEWIAENADENNAEVVTEAFRLLKRRIQAVAKNQRAESAIDKAVRRVDPK